MTENHDPLDRELAELGAQWRAETPADFVIDEVALRRDRGPRRGWLTGAAAAAVVVLAVLGALALRPSDDDVAPAEPPTDVVNRLDCARPAAAPVTGSPVVPEKAVAIRLCGRERSAAGFDAAWPGDTLTGEGAASLTAAINDLAPYDAGADPACPRTEPFALVLRYADGSRVWLRGDGGADCARLTVRGGQVWSGAADISALALQLIDQQRTQRPGTRDPIPPLCPQEWRNVATTIGVGPVTPDDTVAMTACQYRLETPDGFSLTDPDATGRLDLQAVVGDPRSLLHAATEGSPEDPCDGRSFRLAATQRVLILRDVHGDIQVVPTERCWASTLSGTAAYPSPALVAQVADLFPQAP